MTMMLNKAMEKTGLNTPEISINFYKIQQFQSERLRNNPPRLPTFPT